MPISPDLLPVRCRLCQAMLPGWLRLADSPHTAMLLHHLGAMHRDEFQPYLDGGKDSSQKLTDVSHIVRRA